MNAIGHFAFGVQPVNQHILQICAALFGDINDAVELVADLTDSLAGTTRGTAGLELPAVTLAAQTLAATDTLGWEAAFLRAAARGRPAWRARVAQWPEVDSVLSELMVRIALGGADAGRAARATARELDRLLGATR